MAVLIAATLVLLLGAVPNSATAQPSMLHANGRNIVNANGSTVVLEGVNLGGWFVMEQWMVPLDSTLPPGDGYYQGVPIPDTYGVMQQLDSRFGVATEQSLIRTYQQNWITAADLDNIKNAGFNVVRVPVWYGQFYLLNNVSKLGWRSDAFTQLDWLVNAASQRGLYVIIDMHGVVGGQSISDDTGYALQNQYWTSTSDQLNTAWMWQQIASHYQGNATIAGYDLINEPSGAPSNDAVINAYNSLYQAVRAVDPSHMIFIEGTFGSWDWSMLPDPSSEGWTNVVYEMHEYQYNQGSSGVEQGATNQVNDFNNHTSYNVPGYIGEFNDFANGASTWQFSVNAFNQAGLSWSMWSYKADGVNPNAWGFYDPTSALPVPNIASDSASSIAADWEQTATAQSFTQNTSLGLSGNENSTSVSTTAWFNVVDQSSGSCVDDANWGTANGTIVQQWSCGTQQYNQEWQFQSQGNGAYSVTSRNAPGEVWNVTNNGTADGSPLQLWSSTGGTNELWMPVSLGNGLYKFVGVGSGKCIDITYTWIPLFGNGWQFFINDCNGSSTQSFSLSAQP